MKFITLIEEGSGHSAMPMLFNVAHIIMVQSRSPSSGRGSLVTVNRGASFVQYAVGETLNEIRGLLNQ